MDVAEQRALRQGYLLGLHQAQADPGYGRANRTPNTLQNIPITEEDKGQPISYQRDVFQAPELQCLLKVKEDLS